MTTQHTDPFDPVPESSAWGKPPRRPRVYLAGPINGATDAEAHDWRDAFAAAHPEWEIVDPMVRDYRGREDEAVAEIVENDKADIDSSDYVIAYCPKPSVGTSMEILYTYLNDALPDAIVVVPDGAPVSPWLRYHASTVVRTTAEAAEFIAGPVKA